MNYWRVGWGTAFFALSTAVGCGSEKGAEADLGSDDGADGGLHVDDGSGGTGSGGNRDCDPQPGCNDLAVEFESLTPTVMILVDRSSSMFDIPFGDSPNRWQPLKDALVGPDGVVTQLHDAVRFGFAAYTHQQVNGADKCPLTDSVQITDGNYDDIKALYDEVSVDPATTGPDKQIYKGETPTGAAIRSVLPILKADPNPGPKFLMLVTDGEPDTCATPDPQCGQDEAIAAVQAAYAENVQTFVVGVGEIGSEHLQDLANAGMGQPVVQRGPNECDETGSLGTYSSEGGDASYYKPSDPGALRKDIGGIIGSVRSCEFTLNTEVDLEKVGQGTVLLDCEGVPYDDPDGWRMNSATELELLGDSCSGVKTSVDPFVYITFPCDVIVK